MNKSILRKGILGSFAVASAFTAGYATGGSEFATSLNRGLANAFQSVGQNLFGSAAFGVFVPPTWPSDPMRLDFADNLRLPVALNVFVPPNPISPVDPCHSYFQVELTGGAAVLKYDPN
ncbi:MAG: hypothetical protein ACREWG_06070 [Gammaproteobacteria bacterium]